MVWKDVVGYEGIYEVSDKGQIRTCEGKITYSDKHGKRKWKQRVLKQKVGKERSCRVQLYKNKETKTWLVHRVVALAFIPKEEGKDYINHKDGNRLNNDVSNLEWCNHKENSNHAFDTGLVKTCHNISLFDKVTKRRHYFRSKAKASDFLGKSHGFVSNLLNTGKTEYENYKIIENNGQRHERT